MSMYMDESDTLKSCKDSYIWHSNLNKCIKTRENLRWEKTIFNKINKINKNTWWSIMEIQKYTNEYWEARVGLGNVIYLADLIINEISDLQYPNS